MSRIHSNFLLQGQRIGMTLLFPAYPRAEALKRIGLVAANGYSDIDFYACNRGDNPYHQSHHFTDATLNPEPLLACCKHAKQLGLRVTLWGFADDSNWTLADALRKQGRFLRLLEPHIARYIPALEGDETFKAEGVHELVSHAASICAVPLYLHWTHGMVGGASWDHVRGLYYQYESSAPTCIEAETREHVGKWHDAGKQFVSGEFYSSLSQDESRACGDAAIRGGADGSACGASGFTPPHSWGR